MVSLKVNLCSKIVKCTNTRLEPLRIKVCNNPTLFQIANLSGFLYKLTVFKGPIKWYFVILHFWGLLVALLSLYCLYLIILILSRNLFHHVHFAHLVAFLSLYCLYLIILLLTRSLFHHVHVAQSSCPSIIIYLIVLLCILCF